METNLFQFLIIFILNAYTGWLQLALRISNYYCEGYFTNLYVIGWPGGETTSY